MPPMFRSQPSSGVTSLTLTGCNQHVSLKDKETEYKILVYTACRKDKLLFHRTFVCVKCIFFACTLGQNALASSECQSN